MDILNNYFSSLSKIQKKQYGQLQELYTEWNEKINVISRKDIDYLYEKHVLHSLGIAKIIDFSPNSRVLDVGTGGGFPGIPLAILYPQTFFYLIDLTGKKIKVVEEICSKLQLKNVETRQQNARHFKQPVDFIVSRAVTQMKDFVPLVSKNCAKKNNHSLKNGILYLKGGDLTDELIPFPKAITYNLSDYFKEEFFETKKVVYLPL